MPIELTMPALSPTMEEGTLARWLVKVGDIVQPGDLIAEIETDKATMEFEAADEGRIEALIVAEGTDEVKVGTVIALLVEAEERFPAATVLESSGEVLATSPSQQQQQPLPLPEVGEAVVEKAEPLSIPYEDPAADVALRATPLARRLARQSGIDLAQVRGSGANGRVVRADLGLEQAVAPLPSAPGTVPVAGTTTEPDYAAPAGVPHTSRKLSGMRKTIARRLTLSKQTVPHFYLSIDCRIDPLLELRASLNAALSVDGIKLSVNDFLIKALARTLEEVPDANVQFAGEEIYYFGRVDVSMAVALEAGLVTPVIADAGCKRLSVIAREAQALAASARDGTLVPAQYRGGTVSISNLGMFGIERIFPVINPPQAMILGVGTGEQRMRVVDGQPAVATMLTITASFDHRAIDGAIGARAMAALRRLIEEPVTLLA